MMKSILFLRVFIITLFSLFLFLGKQLNPFSQDFFTFHDTTQPVRIIEQAYAIKNGNFPPRILPHVSFGLGFPTPNFYAPSSYYLPTVLQIIGVPIVINLKLTFLFILIISFFGSFFFLKKFFHETSSLLGSAIYTSSLYLALDIFTRGNIAESFFIALLPLALYLLIHYQRNPSYFVMQFIIMHLILTAHNVFSFLFILVAIIVIFLLSEQKKRALLVLILGIFSGLYFYIPLITESYATYARQIATSTKYTDHFLCFSQLYKSIDGLVYGGSIAGCNDPMIFKVGWPQIASITIGIIILIWKSIFPIKNKPQKKTLVLMIFTTLLFSVSIYLTLFPSIWIWNTFSNIMDLVQFPWRFLSFIPICSAIFAAYSFDYITHKKIGFVVILSAFLAICSMLINSKYFVGNTIKSNEFNNTYTNEDYIRNTAIYSYVELLPRTVLLSEYLKYKPVAEDRKLPNVSMGSATLIKGELQELVNKPLYKSFILKPDSSAFINIHDFLYWQKYVNNAQLKSYSTDKLGRPIIENNSTIDLQVTAKFALTANEYIGNVVSLVTFCFVWYYALYVKRAQKKISNQ